MKSRTSLFNWGALKKDITRFAPLWGLYTVFMLLYLFLSIDSESNSAFFAYNAPFIMQSMGIVNLFYAGLCALLLFGDLFNTRLAGALHAMPLRREGWFLTHLTAGMLFCVVPNLLGALIAAAYLGEYAYLAFLWLAIMILQYLFFFGVGAFSAQCAGNALGAVAVYGLINYLAVLLSWLGITFYQPLLFGIEVPTTPALQLSPAVRFLDSQYLDLYLKTIPDRDLAQVLFLGYLQQDWLYLFVAAAVGILFLAAAVLLYRKRDLEKAGDFMAVKSAKPVFLLLYTLCVGSLFYLIGQLTSIGYAWAAIGFAVGYFTGWMLLEKKVGVFKAKRFLGFGILLAVFFATVILTWLDPAGITRYVPETDKINAVTISPNAYRYQDDGSRTLTDPADIDAIRDIHRQLALARNENYENTMLNLTYMLKNGTTVTRRYYVLASSDIGRQLKGYYSHMSALFDAEDPQTVLMDAEYVEFNSHTDAIPSMVFTDDLYSYQHGGDPKELYGDDCLMFFEETSLHTNTALVGLLEAMEKDCREGHMAQVWEYHPGHDSLGYIAIHTSQGQYTTTVTDITVYADCINTWAYLKELAQNAQ